MIDQDSIADKLLESYSELQNPDIRNLVKAAFCYGVESAGLDLLTMVINSPDDMNGILDKLNQYMLRFRNLNEKYKNNLKKENSNDAIFTNNSIVLPAED